MSIFGLLSMSSDERPKAFRPWTIVPLAGVLLLGAGCGSRTSGLEMHAETVGQEQQAVAAHYQHEAALFHQKAADLFERAESFQRMFGADSDWAVSARTLAEYYEKAAREREYQAERHQALASQPKR